MINNEARDNLIKEIFAKSIILLLSVNLTKVLKKRVL